MVSCSPVFTEYAGGLEKEKMPFDNITGHAKEKSILWNSIQNGRVAHAYLFAGPDGVGKRALAREFAKALNCSGTGMLAGFGPAMPCDECADCHAIAALTHQSVLELQPADKDGEAAPDGLIRIGQVRELQETLRFKVERGMKVAIVEAADKLMPAAANAFLKTLEEPPPDSVIILVTSRPQELLPTILSRCQRVGFRPLPDGVVKDYLVSERGMTGADASAVARLGAGSLGRALSFVDSGLTETRKVVIEKIRGLRRDDTFGALKLAEELSKRDDLEDVLEFLKTVCRDRLVSLEGAPGLIVNSDLGVLSAGADVRCSALIDSFSMIEEARYNTTAPRYVNRQLAMEALLLGLSASGALS